MTSMPSQTPLERVVFAGVDTHRDTVHVAVADAGGGELADREFPTTEAGYAGASRWLAGHGSVACVGVEGTASYGCGFTRWLRQVGLSVVEVDRPDRRARRRSGKSDPLDAYAAAQAVRCGRARTVPKTQDGPVEAIRVLRTVRRSAVKASTQAVNQLKSLLVTAAPRLRQQLHGLGTRKLVATCARMRPGADAADPVNAYRHALRRLARRIQHLQQEIDEADQQLRGLVTAAAPRLLEQVGVGVDTAATLLAAAGDNPERMRTEASFARLCGVAPIPASSGRTQRHRLHRGGNRDANRALYITAITRMRHCPATRAYVERRTTEGLSKPEIIRCLKRYIAREIYYLLINPRPTATTPAQAA